MKAKIVPDFLAIAAIVAIVAIVVDKGLYGRVPVRYSPDFISLDNRLVSFLSYVPWGSVQKPQ